MDVSKVELLWDGVLLELVEVEQKTASGIILVHQDESKYRWQTCARVVNVGPEVNSVKVGDNVLFERFAGRVMQFSGRDYLLLAERDLLAKVDG